jgi:hypothetical protein
LHQDKKLMRKVDLWLIPWLCLLYLLSFLDRTNIGNARLAGMEEDLGMASLLRKPAFETFTYLIIFAGGS